VSIVEVEDVPLRAVARRVLAQDVHLRKRLHKQRSVLCLHLGGASSYFPGCRSRGSICTVAVIPATSTTPSGT
jgi:hypothetical protein